MKITYHGHSCIQIESGDHSLIIDPFISPNPNATTDPASIQAQYILLSHAHGDHIADALELAKRNEATIISIVELATYLGWQGAPHVHGMNIGGGYNFDFGRVKLTQAFHSSSVTDDQQQTIQYMGMPAGFLIKLAGKTIYFAGDTCLFSDMKMLGELNDIDVAFLPIGDNFTMGPEDAVIAAKWLAPKLVIPVHYNTFPIIRQDPHQFVADLGQEGIHGKVLDVGLSMEI